MIVTSTGPDEFHIERLTLEEIGVLFALVGKAPPYRKDRVSAVMWKLFRDFDAAEASGSLPKEAFSHPTAYAVPDDDILAGDRGHGYAGGDE